MAKAKIEPGAENEKKDDSGNETGAGDNEPEEDSEIVHYDKTKSFFDNISCEAVERSKGLVIFYFIYSCYLKRLFYLKESYYLIFVNN